MTPTPNDLQSLISYHDAAGPVVICGDFNVDIQANHNQKSRSRLLNDLLSHHSVSQSSLSNGPDYTFFNNAHHSTIDYIIASSSISDRTSSCFTHPHHSLNLSDHLSISLSLLTVSLYQPPLHF